MANDVGFASKREGGGVRAVAKKNATHVPTSSGGSLGKKSHLLQTWQNLAPHKADEI